MVTLKGAKIFLRALEPEDLGFLHEIENDESVWDISHTNTPYSKFILQQYLENAHRDIYDVKQLRLVICNYENETLGLIDIFDFDVKHKRAGIGVLIKDAQHRARGFGKEALQLLINYCASHLDMHQLYCNISEENTQSIRLFQNQGFEIVGLKKDWNFIKGNYKNEYLLQRIFS
ncbi:GNAT family N-acetyltransferase [Subsaximicrobium wynnwilliamsii]|jgi:diamine N-acetyltransferase|uniref:GNAT family N-acetyltransferase n=1 Tax=Subsaximicrobium wynnwilliamsii TaxID=291179 RepID=A0A5C6ZGE8_9FLAO|nr:GNAT family N-acetyltransferase [Subsaximicrobium wynnwilliamsii]TXD83028.1 GNAT family N-acetyltransferase [Subsaximicrobium wynnwilliamsii]TXD88772.1 GNAT family N-acetyltransferase [Subsaximicrobium wynnwilliamsii]TXE02845.1 GNAT family N-acetyltransferase [Subsaximicrobium wynnwilliamsii]